jgi:hypothetical protein
MTDTVIWTINDANQPVDVSTWDDTALIDAFERDLAVYEVRVVSADRLVIAGVVWTLAPIKVVCVMSCPQEYHYAQAKAPSMAAVAATLPPGPLAGARGVAASATSASASDPAPARVRAPASASIAAANTATAAATLSFSSAGPTTTVETGRSVQMAAPASSVARVTVATADSTPAASAVSVASVSSSRMTDPFEVWQKDWNAWYDASGYNPADRERCMHEVLHGGQVDPAPTVTAAAVAAASPLVIPPSARGAVSSLPLPPLPGALPTSIGGSASVSASTIRVRWGRAFLVNACIL